ncbi:MAG: bifunctional nuclease family protein [Acidobacteria bacterium]|nr:bifunctional nuclease family protein [Acidobacteriota bacterium]
MELVKMEIKGLMLDPVSNMPIVILKEVNSNQLLPIWIGVFEANAIMIQLENISTPRPMTHDLMRSILDQLNVIVEKIVVTELKNNTYFALIHLEVDGRKYTIDARPSDAIALALRTGSPIYANREVIEQAQKMEVSEEGSESERIKKWFEDLDAEDFGKYKM